VFVKLDGFMNSNLVVGGTNGAQIMYTGKISG